MGNKGFGLRHAKDVLSELENKHLNLPSKKMIIEGFQSTWIGKATDYVNDKTKISSLLKQAQSYLEKSALAKVAKELKLLLDYLADTTSGNYNCYAVVNITLAIAAIVYVVNPMDIIPDALVGIGFIDDATVITWSCNQLSKELDSYRKWRSNL